MSVRIINADVMDGLALLDDESIHCVVTSPPYYGLRNYQCEGQIGLEKTHLSYVAKMVEIFREVRRVLCSDGICWLNLGDSYASGKGTCYNPGGNTSSFNTHLKEQNVHPLDRGNKSSLSKIGLKPKDMIGVPWAIAFALRDDGWYLRQWLPWVKRNPMPESTRDRPTSACEIVFMLTKCADYFYDYEAVRRCMVGSSVARLAQDIGNQAGSSRANGGAKTNGPMKAVRHSDKQRGHSRRHAGFNDRWDAMEKDEQCETRAYRNSDLFFSSLDYPFGAIGNENEIIALDVATHSFKEAHFATFPPKLIEPLIKAGCPEGGTVLDPFGGAGTTGLVADRLKRNAILIELNPEYAAMAESRINGDCPMFAEVSA